MAKVLVVDDEELCRKALERRLVHDGFEVHTAHDVTQALGSVQTLDIDVIVTDLEMPSRTGLDLVREVSRIDATLPCIVMTGYGSPQYSVEALRSGAFWYLEKPLDRDPDALKRLIGQALSFRQRSQSARKPARAKSKGPKIIGRSESLLSVLRIADRVARSNATVLVTGESGTGKELIARRVYASSPRSGRPFVPINCGAIPEELLESELFGHVRGAFTSAHQGREGRFAKAHTGTIFLDEIGDMSMNLQVKLLRVLQDGTFDPVGSSSPMRVDVRTIAATNQDLRKAIAEQRFREDLFYRLHVVPIHVPALREREDDVILLADYFLEREARRFKRKTPRLTGAAMARLRAYHWPGNVRELENLMERLVVLCEDENDEIDAGDLPAPLDPGGGDTYSVPSVPGGDKIPFNDIVGQFEDEIILRALERTEWNKTRAAEMLGLNRTTLLEMMKKKGIPRKPPQADGRR